MQMHVSASLFNNMTSSMKFEEPELCTSMESKVDLSKKLKLCQIMNFGTDTHTVADMTESS